jgi:enoyl-CoA hydratase/carnithine racemase
MPYETILYAKSGPVLTITLNRPDALNAISPQLTLELHQALDEGDADAEVRAIIVTGAGRAFSAGYDIARRPGGKSTLDPAGSEVADFLKFWWMRDGDAVRRLMHLWHLSKPVIAAVHGWVMGGGFWYSLACDITIAADNAVFAQPEVRHISNTTFLFAALAGWKAAHRYSLTGDHFDAHRPRARAVGAAQQGHHVLRASGDGDRRGDADERAAVEPGARVLQRRAWGAARGHADGRAQGFPRGARRRLPAGALRAEVPAPQGLSPERPSRRRRRSRPAGRRRPEGAFRLTARAPERLMRPSGSWIQNPCLPPSRP